MQAASRPRISEQELVMSVDEVPKILCTKATDLFNR